MTQTDNSAHAAADAGAAVHLALAVEKIDEFEAAGAPLRLVGILRTFATAIAALTV